MGIWFGAVVGLIISGANICEHILGVVIPTNYFPYLHCILIHPDVFLVGGLSAIQQVFSPKADRVIEIMIYELPDRTNSRCGLFLQKK